MEWRLAVVTMALLCSCWVVLKMGEAIDRRNARIKELEKKLKGGK